MNVLHCDLKAVERTSLWRLYLRRELCCYVLQNDAIRRSKECEHIPKVTEGRIVSFSTDGQAYVDFDPQETFRTGLWVQCVFDYERFSYTYQRRCQRSEQAKAVQQ